MKITLATSYGFYANRLYIPFELSSETIKEYK